MSSIQISIPYGLVAFFIIFCGNFKSSFSHGKDKNTQRRIDDTHWQEAVGTWYGPPTGCGSDGGACGYAKAVSEHPFNSMITAISHNLYKEGQGCGVCYQVKCKNNPCCSEKPVRVTVTDLCPECQHNHFDLSGTAFGALAKHGEEDNLRKSGKLQLEFTRVECDYSAKNVDFKIDVGSNPYYLAFVVEYPEGDGDISKVYVRDCLAKPDDWKPMVRSWGALWKYNSPTEMRPPFSVLLKSRYSESVLVAENVIPKDWVPGKTYASSVNFKV
ncbi:putative expansin-B2 [Euphorbia lathyris]|uniref:putative expansin-B2 n=1 Tax=Euphorbia lathyris TaxID=212925 RepID=UPI0033142FDD